MGSTLFANSAIFIAGASCVKKCFVLNYFLSFQAEERLQAKRQARAEAREIRMREIERQQKEVLNAVGTLNVYVLRYWDTLNH